MDKTKLMIVLPLMAKFEYEDMNMGVKAFLDS